MNEKPATGQWGSQSSQWSPSWGTSEFGRILKAHHALLFSESSVVHLLYDFPWYKKGNTHWFPLGDLSVGTVVH